MNANMREICQAIVDDLRTRYSQAEMSDGEFECFMLRRVEIVVEETEEKKTNNPFFAR